MVERLSGPLAEHAVPMKSRHPWYLRLGVSPLGIGVALGIGIPLVSELAWWLAGPIEYERAPFERRLPFVLASSLLYSHWAISYFASAAERDFDLLAQGFSAPAAEIARVRGRLLDVRPLVWWLASGIALAFVIPVQQVNTQRWSRFGAGDWNAFDVSSALIVIVGSLLLYQVIAFALSIASNLGRAVAELREVRLFENGVAGPLARLGLRATALFVLVPVVAFGASVVFGGQPWGTLLLSWLMNLAFSVACMVVPMASLRRWRAALKRAELARVERAIYGDTGALEGSPLHVRLSALDLPGLLAYRREVSDAPEWPFDAPALRRFLVYMVIPPASWLAAAFVERGLDRWLGG